jgi:hypothetical protein
MKRLLLYVGLVLFAVGAPLACSSEEEALIAALGGGCLLDSDCSSGLVCVFRICHEPCKESKDCPLEDDGDHERCVIGDKPRRICQLHFEKLCHLHSDCPGDLVCAVDGECRNQCGGDRDCLPGQLCVAATCADLGELEQGRLVPTSDTSGEGKPCLYDSDCPPGAGGLALGCRDGACDAGCLGSDRDCGKYERCSTDQPGEPGECQLVGQAGALHCSPKDEFPNEKEIACACLGNQSGTQTCNEDASGYGHCTMGAEDCTLP